MKTQHHSSRARANSLRVLIFTTLISALAVAQEPKKEPVALPQPVTPTPAPATPAPATPAPAALPAPSAAPVPKDIPGLTKETPPAATPANGAKAGILVNFKGTPLNEVLNYLSEAAGFVIVQEGPVQGTVDVVSRQPITAEDAVDLLNTVLVEKGYVAIRNGRILKIVNRKDAQKRDLPVDIGSDPEKIPRKDEMVTQILPLRFGEASKLVENLRPLLAENATISANDSSNSILLTDTRTNIRRIAQIIRAIDTSVASISTIHVYQLKYADAKEMANVISQLFANPTGSSGGSSRRGGGDRGGGPFGMFFGGGPPGSGGEQSEAKLANSRVVAASDEQSNSVIVSAPEDLIPTITEMVEKLDTSVTDVTETRIFRLQHADAVELAQIVNELYPDTSSQNSRNNQRGREGGRGFFGGPFGPFGGTSQQASSGQSERSLLQTKVVAVGDPRTNSLVVTSSRETMSMIAEMVGRLDSTDAKKQRVYVYQIKHADADNVANVLRGMLGDQSATTAAGSAASRLSQRSQSGATMDTSDFSTSGNGRGGGGGGSRDR